MSDRSRARRWFSRPRSLRRRLLIGATLLATVAVLTSQVIGGVVLRSWLMAEVDQQLMSFVAPPPEVTHGREPPPPVDNPRLPSQFRVYAYDRSGDFDRVLGSGSRSGPRLARSARELDLAWREPTTVSSASGDAGWRVLRKRTPDGRTIVIALPLDTVEGAMSKLLWLNGALLVATVVGLVAVGRWVVRIGLLPLTRMEDTAGRIADGDLDLRLTDTDPDTEIGRLGRVLNTMIERLRSALRQRENSEARLRRFVADAGHELRTPLTSMRGFAELMIKHESLPEDQRRQAQRMIEQNAERMSRLVEDLLLLAELDREPVYDNETVDLLSVAADAIGSAPPRAGERDIALDPLTNEEPEPVEVLGDSHRLRQVVGNLIANALNHTPPETPVRVRVESCHAGDRAGADRPDRWGADSAFPPGIEVRVIEVADTGPGLTDEQAEQVFERFFRVDRARSREQGGSGLGLAIAAAIARSHGGRLELDTAPGQGATFRLVLPANR